MIFLLYSKNHPAKPAAIRRSLYAASFTFSSFLVSSMDGKPCPIFGCPSVWWLLDVYWEPETQSTQHRRLRLLRSSKTGEGERKFIFNLVTTPAFGRGVITESFITPSFLSSLSRYSSTLSYVLYVYLTVISL